MFSEPEKAQALEITNSDQYEMAGLLWKEIKAFRAKIAETFDPIIQAAHKAHKEAVGKKKEVDTPADLAQRHVKKLMSDYDYEQEQIRLKEEEEARQKALKEEEDRRLEEAQAAEDAGMGDIAETILDQPVEAPTVVVPKSVPKVAGVSFRKVWDFVVEDPDKIPVAYKIPDQVALNNLARAQKSKTNIPGGYARSRRV